MGRGKSREVSLHPLARISDDVVKKSNKKSVAPKRHTLLCISLQVTTPDNSISGYKFPITRRTANKETYKPNFICRSSFKGKIVWEILCKKKYKKTRPILSCRMWYSYYITELKKMQYFSTKK